MMKMLRSWHDFIPISGLVLLTSTIWKGVSIALFFVLTVIVHTPMSGITLPPYVCKIALLFRIGGLFLIWFKIYCTGNSMMLHCAPVSTLNSINWSLMLSLVNISFCAAVVLELLTWTINNLLMSIWFGDGMTGWWWFGVKEESCDCCSNSCICCWLALNEDDG